MALRANLIPEPMLLTIPDSTGFLLFKDIFSNDSPLELEIGSGKGTFLMQMAQKFPDRNFVGIEWAKAYANFAADRLRRHALNNARMVSAEALWWVKTHVPNAALSALHVYFPDPWPKSRHHKRRLIQKPFLLEARRVLKAGGKLNIVTDHAEYFGHIQQTLMDFAHFTLGPFESPLGSETGWLVGTNFEKKYVAEHRPFYAVTAQQL